MANIEYQERFTSHPSDVKSYDTEELREHFLIKNLFEKDKITLIYSHYDRFISGGAVPIDEVLELATIEPLKAQNFCDRREVGILNIGNQGIVTVGEDKYRLGHKEALYIGMGAKNIHLSSEDPGNPAMFYINSAPAHQGFPIKKIASTDTITLDLGTSEKANERRIVQYIVEATVQTCQLQMGITELKKGSIWNTMPPHTHNRRMEVYLYIDLPQDEAICHFMGEPQQTRHVWMGNHQAVISPPWSIHAAAGTSNYSFVWGMAGENLDFSDMDMVKANQLR
ncbi:5-dehydro-4-deoxy-D-glucuronate isomerase [Zobellia galactanivorans]|uniref:4-deoxy-L-threo-5-hexosulose-uronate ketol-isomerase n=1 Tax=Zobellia galactanivorans (strain DSM 12802 / CCUG 47099 / CIP 106680 / NCIMB 13871 / Dsij) TaxID=63186 RepID=G0L0C8_ZOBGA|nr:5-dehydro-4-deoxy-D-glucuronate isomerase [Zobellia galactanivorans]CAZ94262.1 4-deoxy-L-threo-5-hexosulose-uronate ketol-isomerase [Zobellia galactanivorans]